ncbi:sugar kinase [Microvirga sp. G4-2]|uniref:sugar kinase n=1 Tax=Microvirga sp. G4-2 TaxID=3434467 RepID=UPI004043CF6F
MTRIACVGECMIELSQTAPGAFTQGYGGDTLNTAIYLARLGMRTDYVTALGDDSWSEEMLAVWRTEGVGTSMVLRLKGKLPGLYIITTDEAGERSFSYWRDNAAARLLFDNPETDRTIERLAAYDVIYLSGITLSLYSDKGRLRLQQALTQAKEQGCRIAFDTNFRPRGWPDLPVARNAYRQIMRQSDLIFASSEDLHLIFGDQGVEELFAYRASAELILKTPEPACRVLAGETDVVVAATPVADVVDTTAAGDSFAAGYLAARLSGASPENAARNGHRIAGAVVRHRGAIIPKAAMPDLQIR